MWQRSFAHPLHCLWYGDLTNDGLCELVAVSMGGVHILQVQSDLQSDSLQKRVNVTLNIARAYIALLGGQIIFSSLDPPWPHPLASCFLLFFMLEWVR